MPRTVSLVVLAILTLAACFLNAFAQIEWFATAAGVTGFAFGGIQGIVPALASEIFGLRYLATNYAMLQIGPAICKLSPCHVRNCLKSVMAASPVPAVFLPTRRYVVDLPLLHQGTSTISVWHCEC